ncbi:hypothetical protein BSKO_08071 [Bryopsis sp. KO-2023]|nr:hypothetical protein BSKO_08071 [Bryopsis sp. KO-2023]
MDHSARWVLATSVVPVLIGRTILTQMCVKRVSNEAAGTRECATHLREHAVEQSRAQVYGYRLPLILRNGVTVRSVGQVRAHPKYCGRDRLHPVGFASVCHDPAVGQFVSEIQDGGNEGPIFAVHVYPRLARGMARFTVRGTDPNEPWAKLARLQSEALVELGMASDQTLPTHIIPPGLSPSSSQSAAQSFPPNYVPFHHIFAQPSNRPPLTTSTSIMNQGQDVSSPKDTDATGQSQVFQNPPQVQFHQSFQTILSCMAHSFCSQQSMQEYDPGPLAGLMLSAGRTLAGVWGEERFGFTSIELLEILEALPGVETCSGYVPMTCRRGLFMEAYVTHSDAVRKMKEATWAVWELYKRITEAKDR